MQSVTLGSPSWLDAVRDAVNASEDYRRAGAGWRWPLGIAFLDPDGEDRFAVLDLHDGELRDARPVARDDFERAPFRLSGDVDRWENLILRGEDAMRCILLKHLRMEGDALTALRYMPAAKALLDAVSTVEVDVRVG